MNKNINKLIEIAKTNSNKPVKWTEKEQQLDNVAKFCSHFNITSGTYKIHGFFLEALFNTWSKKPYNSKTFHKKLKKIIEYPSTEELKYKIDIENLSININEINKLIGPFMLKRANEEIEKKKERSFKTLGSS